MKRTIRTADMPPGDPYKFLSGLVVPRPIAWVGSRSEDGVNNLAPFSFFNVVSVDPPMVMFCPIGQPDMRKDTLENVQATGAYTVNIVSEAVAEQMNVTSGSVPAEIDEFDLAGLTAIEGDLVAAPRVGEAPVSLECELVEVIPVGNGRMVIGEVKVFHVEEEIFDGDWIVSSRIEAIGRMAGYEYARSTDPLNMVRPK
jgi:flavin reductase (DIM6/NTAB) family NADH-FMN oxidoreductase RutF